MSRHGEESALDTAMKDAGLVRIGRAEKLLGGGIDHALLRGLIDGKSVEGGIVEWKGRRFYGLTPAAIEELAAKMAAQGR